MYDYSNPVQRAALGPGYRRSAEEFLKAEAASLLASAREEGEILAHLALHAETWGVGEGRPRLAVALDAAVWCYMSLASELGTNDVWEELGYASGDRRIQYLQRVLRYEPLRRGMVRALENHCPIG